MIVSAVIVEQLDIDGHLRSFRMRPDHGKHLTIAFAGEYDESRTGPFHFLEHKNEQNFEAGFAECSTRRLALNRFRKIYNGYEFKTSWRGIITERQEISYYALSLPANTIPTLVRFSDPRSNHEFRKSVGKDLQRSCFVLYLECRSSFGSFDFDLQAQFTDPTEKFSVADYSDETTTEFYASPSSFEHYLRDEQRHKVQNFFFPQEYAGDVYLIQQAGAVGPGAKVHDATIEQIGVVSPKETDLQTLAQELDNLYQSAKRQEGVQKKERELEALGSAVKAANSGDSVGVVEHLRVAGRWALNLAKGVGSSVAAAAISKAIGL